MQFPDDDNREALRNMANSGDDLSKPRIVDFSVIFGDLNAAREFQSKVQNSDVKVVINDGAAEQVDVTVSRETVPTHASISDFEAMLDHLASPIGGRNDGWGCFAAK